MRNYIFFSDFSSDQNLCSRILKISLGAPVFLNFGISLQSSVRKSAAFIGFSRIDLQEVLRTNGVLCKTCPIIGENSIVGSVRVSVLIKLMRNLSGKIDRDVKKMIFHQYFIILEPVLRDIHDQTNYTQKNVSTENLPTKSHPTTNESCKKENNVEMSMEHETSKEQVKGKFGPDKFTSSGNQFDNKTSEGEFQPSLPQIYKGLLFIEELKNLKVISNNNFFMTYGGFWNDYNQENTQLSNDVIFNHLKVRVPPFQIGKLQIPFLFFRNFL